MNIKTWNEQQVERAGALLGRLQNINRADKWDYQRHYRLVGIKEYYEEQVYREQYELLRDKKQPRGKHHETEAL